MIKWPITYTTYNDETITEDFYFNLNKAELVGMQLGANGAYSEFITRIMNEHDMKKIGDEFRRILLLSYGKKSDDGKYFRKSDQMREEFEQSEAYANLFIELLTDGDKASKFFKGVLPKDLQDAVEKQNGPNTIGQLRAGNIG